jgi:hypothetical protein
MVSLNDIQGLWRRRLIAWPEGEADTTTEVYWLQGPELYADLRIPKGRPAGRASCNRELDWTMLGFLAWQEGFFGKLEVSASIGHWHRAFDYQPDTGRQDRGHLAFEDDVLIERGVEAPYVEHWIREAHTEEVSALSLAADAPSRTGCLIVAGEAFMFARSRSAPLPPGADLNECLEAAGSLQEAQDLFDCEISFGRVRDQQWRIERSSLPFREGHVLQPDVDGGTGRLLLDDLTPEGAFVRCAWQITAPESARLAPASLFQAKARGGAVGAEDSDLIRPNSGAMR